MTPRREWNTDAEWKRLRARLADEPAGVDRELASQPGLRRALVAAAILIIAAGIGGAAWIGAEYAWNSAGDTHTVATARAQQLTVSLPDGTNITLGPASRLTYSIARGSRSVRLTGLASFRVAHDARRPFVLTAAGATMVDLGTEFTVRAYAEDSAVLLAVSSGSVAMHGAASDRDSVVLHGGDVGTLSGGGVPTVRHDPDISRYSAWTHGRLAFDDETLSDVAEDLSRWFDVDVRVATPALGRRRVSGTYDRASLGDVLTALAASLGIRGEQSAHAVTLRDGVAP